MSQVIDFASESQVLQNGGAGNLKSKVRVFSLRGSHLVAMFAKTEKAKGFRRWLLDVLESIQETGSFQLETPTEKEQLLLTDGRKSLAKAVSQVVALKKRHGVAVTHKDFWSLVHIKSGMKKVETATPEQIETAMVYVGEVLEGELLHPEPELPGFNGIDNEQLSSMVKMMRFTAERINTIVEFERNLEKYARVAEEMKMELTGAMYKTSDLSIYMKMYANLLDKNLAKH